MAMLAKVIATENARKILRRNYSLLWNPSTDEVAPPYVFSSSIANAVIPEDEDAIADVIEEVELIPDKGEPLDIPEDDFFDDPTCVEVLEDIPARVTDNFEDTVNLGNKIYKFNGTKYASIGDRNRAFQKHYNIEDDTKKGECPGFGWPHGIVPCPYGVELSLETGIGTCRTGVIDRSGYWENYCYKCYRLRQQVFDWMSMSRYTKDGRQLCRRCKEPAQTRDRCRVHASKSERQQYTRHIS